MFKIFENIYIEKKLLISNLQLLFLVLIQTSYYNSDVIMIVNNCDRDVILVDCSAGGQVRIWMQV